MPKALVECEGESWYSWSKFWPTSDSSCEGYAGPQRGIEGGPQQGVHSEDLYGGGGGTM